MLTLYRRALARPILFAIFVIWIVEAGLNATFGMRMGGPLYALMFFAFAVVGAWCAEQFAEVQGNTAGAWGNRVKFAVPLVLCIALSQFAGWSVLGITLADGGVQRSTEASQRTVAGEALDNARAERKAIGTPRAIAAIEAERLLECKRTSRQYKDGVGPACTKLRAEEETARRAGVLDAQIAELVTRVADAPQVADGAPHISIVMAITGASRERVEFWVPVFIVAMIGLGANLGFALAAEPRAPIALAPPHEAWDFGPKRLSYVAPGDSPPSSRPPGANANFEQRYAPQASRSAPTAVRSETGSDRPWDQPVPHRAADPSTMHGGSVHGAPITINLSAADYAPRSRQEALDAPAPVAMIDHVSNRNVAVLRAAARQPVRDEAMPTSPLPPDVPTDKSAVNAALDGLCVFASACVQRQANAWVSADVMFERYAEWAGDRAMTAPAFHTLFPVATNTPLSPLGGAMHYAGVILKRPQLAAREG